MTEQTPTLKDLGISKNESSNAQKLAKLDDKDFEEHKERLLQHHTKAGVNKMISNIKRKEQFDKAQKLSKNELKIDQSYQYTEVINQQIIQILQNHFGGETRLAPADKDLHEATDFQVFKVGKLDIAVRMRNMTYIKYRHQITFRLWTNDTQTEWQKVCEGFGDYMLYGFVDNDKIVTYKIVNLDDIRTLVRSQSPKLHYETHDNSNNSGLVAIDVSDIPHFSYCTPDLKNAT